MSHSTVPRQPDEGGLYAVLDANVLIPARLSDLLFDLALEGLYQPLWQAQIESEFKKNWAALLQAKHPGAKIDPTAAERRLNAFRNAAPEHLIIGHTAAAITKQIPERIDQKDRHVAAAGLVLVRAADEDRSARIMIVSANTKDLAVRDMGRLGVKVVRPGAFIDLLYGENPTAVKRGTERVLHSLSKPPYTKADVLGVLRVHRAAATADGLARSWRINA